MIEKKNVSGPESIEYVKSQLLRGYTLSNCVIDLPVENGTIYSYAPSGILNEQLYNFPNGGLYQKDIELLRSKPAILRVTNEAKILVRTEIINFLKEGKNNYCLFEDSRNKPSFPWVTSSGTKYVCLNSEEMYYFFDQNKFNEKEFDGAWNGSETYIFLCVLSTLNPEKRGYFNDFASITRDILSQTANNASGFFLRAYDGEGYLKWEKEQSLKSL